MTPRFDAKRVAAALAGALVTFALLQFMRGYPPRLALMVALASGAFLYAAIGNLANLRRLLQTARSGYEVDWGASPPDDATRAGADGGNDADG
ncbi:MAG: hypothetical protein AAF772_12585 [Acidobacteriota bacterium]